MAIRIIGTGFLAADPDVRNVGDNVVCNFRIGSNSPYKDRDGNTHTEWTNVSVWGKAADACGKYLKKGSQVEVLGEKRTRSYDKDGHEVKVTECVSADVTFLDRKSDNERDRGRNNDHGRGSSAAEDIPF